MDRAAIAAIASLPLMIVTNQMELSTCAWASDLQLEPNLFSGSLWTKLPICLTCVDLLTIDTFHWTNSMNFKMCESLCVWWKPGNKSVNLWADNEILFAAVVDIVYGWIGSGFSCVTGRSVRPSADRPINMNHIWTSRWGAATVRHLRALQLSLNIIPTLALPVSESGKVMKFFTKVCQMMYLRRLQYASQLQEHRHTFPRGFNRSEFADLNLPKVYDVNLQPSVWVYVAPVESGEFVLFQALIFSINWRLMHSQTDCCHSRWHAKNLLDYGCHGILYRRQTRADSAPGCNRSEIYQQL